MSKQIQKFAEDMMSKTTAHAADMEGAILKAKAEYSDQVFRAIDHLSALVHEGPIEPSPYVLASMKQLEHAVDTFARGYGHQLRKTGEAVIARMQEDAAGLANAARCYADAVPMQLFLADGTEYDRDDERKYAVQEAINAQLSAAEKYAQARIALERHA